LDIIFGALLGILLGTLCYNLKVWTVVQVEGRIERRKARKKESGGQKVV